MYLRSIRKYYNKRQDRRVKLMNRDRREWKDWYLQTTRLCHARCCENESGRVAEKHWCREQNMKWSFYEVCVKSPRWIEWRNKKWGTELAWETEQTDWKILELLGYVERTCEEKRLAKIVYNSNMAGRRNRARPWLRNFIGVKTAINARSLLLRDASVKCIDREE